MKNPNNNSSNSMHKLSILVTLVSVLLLIQATESVAQEKVNVVSLTNGSKITGTIIKKMPNKSIKMKTRDGNEEVNLFEQIEMITMETFDEDTSLWNVSYPELGLVLGPPSLFNFAFGYWYGPLGIRATGGYWADDQQGIQGIVGFKLSENIHRRHNLAISIGRYDMSGGIASGLFKGGQHYRGDYIGLMYELNVAGFFLQAGWNSSIGRRDNKIMLQLGYMHRFLPK